MQPELRALERALLELATHPVLAPLLDDGGELELGQLELEQIAELLADDAGRLLLMGATGLNRTSLRAGAEAPHAQLVAAPQRRAFVVKSQLPAKARFATLVEVALSQRRATLGRTSNAETEKLFKDRLAFEGLPIRMAGAWTSGVLIDRRKPDGVYPDPETGKAPELYLEVKKVNRPRDDIQKRLYEIAEVSLEVKLLYGGLALTGLNLSELLQPDAREEARSRLRAQIVASRPVVVALLLTEFEHIEHIERYRPGAEAFIDRVFLADEIDECVEFLAGVCGGGAEGAS